MDQQALYRKRHLDRYVICARCAKVAKRFQLAAQLRLLGPESTASHLEQAMKWNDESSV